MDHQAIPVAAKRTDQDRAVGRSFGHDLLPEPYTSVASAGATWSVGLSRLSSTCWLPPPPSHWGPGRTVAGVVGDKRGTQHTQRLQRSTAGLTKAVMQVLRRGRTGLCGPVAAEGRHVRQVCGHRGGHDADQAGA